MAFPLGNLPTQGEKNALAGSTGSPDTGNEYITKVERAAANGVATLNGSSLVTQRLSYEAASGGVATLDGSSKVVQHSSYEGIANGVATLDANVKIPIAQLTFAPVAASQTSGFTASTAYVVWPCNTTGGSFTATLMNANSVPNGWIVTFFNTGSNTLNVGTTGGNTLTANSSSIGTSNNSSSFVSDGVSTWYQITKV